MLDFSVAKRNVLPVTGVISGRLAADYSGSLVVFLIGMRINHFHKVGKWWPVVRAMPAMIAELSALPDSGFLGHETSFLSPRTICLTQYWRDFDSLETYARDRDAKHWPAWTAFNRAIGDDGTVGIFHETYVIEKNGFEAIYVNMPLIGLGKVTGLVPATGKRSESRLRMQTVD